MFLPDLTKCKKKGKFPYTAVFEKPPNFVEIGLGYGFGHFFDEMRLNQVCIENQNVTKLAKNEKASI